MDNRQRVIADMAESGVTRYDIAQKMETSIKNIDRILSIKSVMEYRKTRKKERNSRSNLGNGERVSKLITTLIESVERELDNCTDDNSRLALTDRIASLSRLVTMPEDSAGKSFPVVILPETKSIEEFNLSTLNRIREEKKDQKPESGLLTPGGSKMSSRTQKSPNESPEEELPPGEMEIDDAYREVEAEIEESLEELMND